MEDSPDLVGIHEIAALLGLTRQRVDRISRTDTDFPEPLAVLHAGRIWSRSAVLGWAQARGRRVATDLPDG